MRSFILPVVALAYSVFARNEYTRVAESTDYYDDRRYKDEDFVKVPLNRNEHYDRHPTRDEYTRSYKKVTTDRTMPHTHSYDYDDHESSLGMNPHIVSFEFYK